MHTSHRSLLILAGALMLADDCVLAQPTASQPGQKIWEFSNLARDSFFGEFSSPALGEDGTLYSSGGRSKNTVYALDSATGTKKWEVTTAPSWLAPAVGADGTVYISPLNKKVYALDGSTGTIKWEFLTGDSVQSPLALSAGGLIYASSLDGELHALDAVTGVRRWTFQTGVRGAVIGSPVIGADGTVYFGSSYSDPNVYALEGGTGARKWAVTVDARDGGRVGALGADGTVYVVATSKLYAFDGFTGLKKWEFPAKNLWSSPVVGIDGTVYLVQQNGALLTTDPKPSESKLYALDGATGNKKWEIALVVPSTADETEKVATFIFHEPFAVAADSAVYVAVLSGRSILALDAGSGARKWEVQIEDPVAAAPLLDAKGVLYVPTWSSGKKTAKISAFQAPSGLALSSWPKPRRDTRNSGSMEVVGAPLILRQPVNQSVAVGSSVTIAAYAGGTRPLHYQWQFNGQPLSGATESSLTISAVQWTNAGSYSVVISNGLGRVNSAPAVLTVGYALTLKTLGAGRVTRRPDLPVYPPGTSVELLAVPDEGHTFLGWQGTLATQTNRLSFVMSTNFQLTANFTRAPGQLLWTFQTGGAVSAPAIATDGTVYYRSGTNTVYALDGQTGTKKWEFQATNHALDSFPVVGPEGTVYVTTANTSRSTVYALDGATGLDKSRFAQFYGAPAVNTDGTLFLRKWVEGPVRITQRLPGGAWSVNALDSPLGSNKWEFVIDCCGVHVPAVGFGHSMFVVQIGQLSGGFPVTGQDVYGAVYALDSVTGKERWRSELSLYPTPPALGSDGTVYVVSQHIAYNAGPGSLAALDGLTGRPRWTAQIGQAEVFPVVQGGGEIFQASPVIGPDETVYVGSFSGFTDKGRIYALDGGTGALKWQRGGMNVSQSPALAADGTLYLPDRGGVLALDSRTGEIKWKYEIGKPVSSVNVGSEGTVYFGCDDRKAYALKGTTGLAPGPWPKFQQNAQNTGMLQLPNPPALLAQPTNQSALVGARVKLEVVAAGALPLQYQWRKDDQPILAATNHFLLLLAVELSDTGKYSVQVSNSLGSVTSTGAVLTVGYSLVTDTRGGKGSVRRNPNLAVYPPGTRVELLAVPEGDRGFVRWEGALVEKANPVTVTVETNLEITAVFQPRSGDALWRLSITNSGYASGPAIGADGILYVALSNRVYALDGLTRTWKWESPALVIPGPFPYMPTANSVTEPVLGHDGTVYVGSSAGVFGLDGKTGAKRWEFLGTGSVTAPAIGIDGTVYVGSTGGKIYSLNGATGQKNWEYDTKGLVGGPQALGTDGTVYVASRNASGIVVHALDGATGNKIWEFLSAGSVNTSFAIGGDGTIYFGVVQPDLSSVSGKFYAVNGRTGRMKWVLTGDISGFSSAVVGADDTVFVAYAFNYRYGQVYRGALDALEGPTGKKKWSFHGDFFSPFSTPVLGADGTLYFGSTGGRLYALDAATGSKKWDSIFSARFSCRRSKLR